MKENLEEKKKIDLDERGNPLMTVKTLKYYCDKESLYQTPELNEKLYLQFKGFREILSLEEYPNLATIWLNNNCISEIQGLNSLKNLICLNLNNNIIGEICNLHGLDNLQVLNLAHNRIERISGLSPLKKLTTLNVAQNFLTDLDSIRGLADCSTLNNLNLCKNEIQNSETLFKFLITFTQFICLYMKATPLSRGFKNYRKRLIAALPKLKFLDDRPIQQIDHRLAQAWVEGGPELEKEERSRIANEKDEKSKRDTKQFNQKLDRERQRNEKIIELTQLKNQLQENESNAEQIKELDRKIQILKDGPKGFQAQITDTSLKILCVAKEDEEKIIDKYFYNEKKKVAQNIQRMKEGKMEDVQEISAEQNEREIQEKVQKILEIKESEKEDASYLKNWDSSYEKLLEALLEKHKFDFWEVQPQLNMILAEVNKKMVRPHRRFEVQQLQQIWTEVELRRRKLN